jgi:murein DD-endopeptidase MepM/ murein hydrolase activator NlpD
MPVPGKPTGIFGERRFFNGQPRSPHPGLDLKAATGTPVLAAGAGRVALACDLYWTGGTVVIDHGGGLFTVYGHLSKVEVAEGTVVEAGARVGLSGATGRVTGPHLHWGAKIGDVPVDPRALRDARLFP